MTEHVLPPVRGSLMAGRRQDGEAPPPRFLAEVLVLLLVGTLTFAFAASLEFNEWLSAHTKPFERFQVDELPVTILVVLLVMMWLSWHRGRRLEREYALRLAAQQAFAEQAQENRRLAQMNMLAQEAERKALAHEIHDELGQSLNAIKLDAVAIRKRRWQTAEELDQYADSIVDLTNHLHESVRALSRRLRPVALDELGLRDAIDLYVSHWEKRSAPVQAEFTSQGDLDGLGEQINITLYRCIQECLTNINRHAAASRVDVSLVRAADGVLLTVSDDGRGMVPGARHFGLGHIGMRERVESLGGEFLIDSRPGEGTRIVLRVPLADGASGRTRP